MKYMRSGTAAALTSIRGLVGLGILFISSALTAQTTQPKLMVPQDLATLVAQAPDARLAYGADPNQIGELRIPGGRGPHPIVVLVHGGCFKSEYANLSSMGAMGDALKTMGIATWSIEYRRLGNEGGGWPGTQQDVGRAVDYLRMLAKSYALDLNRVVIVGHSAGGNLGMWAAARARLPSASALYTPNPLKIRGVVDLAGPLDLSVNIDGYESLCMDRVITSLLGGTPQTVPERYREASPQGLLPLRVPQVLVIGEYEEYVPLALVQAYVQAARSAGDSVKLEVIPGVGHFEIASPFTVTWPIISRHIRALLEG